MTQPTPQQKGYRLEQINPKKEIGDLCTSCGLKHSQQKTPYCTYCNQAAEFQVVEIVVEETLDGKLISRSGGITPALCQKHI